MKVIASDPWRLRKPALKGAVVVDTFRGTIRVRAWPQKRGRPKSAAVRQQNEWFKAVNKLTREIPASQQKLAIAITKNSGQYPRDLLMTSVSRGVFDFADQNGRSIQMREERIEVAGFQGARWGLSQNIALAQNSAWRVPFDVAVLDTAQMLDPAKPGVITIPQDVDLVEFTCGLRIEAGAGSIGANIREVGAAAYTAEWRQASEQAWLTMTSGPLPVSPGEEYEVQLFIEQTGRTLNAAGGTWFAATITTVLPALS